MLVGAALSFVVSATAVLPLLYSLAPIVGPAAGLSPAALIVPIVVGVGVTSFSPFSVGGATALIGAPPEVSNKLFEAYNQSPELSNELSRVSYQCFKVSY